MKNQRNNLILSASSIEGTTVRTPADEKVGDIKDIMLDTHSGEVVYAVLSVDTGFLNLGNKYFAIPWQALTFDTAQEEVVIFDVNKEKLENAPGFDKDNWPSEPQPEFVDEVHSYYGYEAYSERVNY